MGKLFGSVKAEDLKNKSSKVVDIFTSTMQKLSDINDTASIKQKIIKDQIDELQREHDSHTEVITSNNKVISKFKKLFEEENSLTA